MLSAGLEPAIPANERPQTHALDRVASGIDICSWYDWLKFIYLILCIFRAVDFIYKFIYTNYCTPIIYIHSIYSV
jgi:hypothetical protein